MTYGSPFCVITYTSYKLSKIVLFSHPVFDAIECNFITTVSFDFINNLLMSKLSQSFISYA